MQMSSDVLVSGVPEWLVSNGDVTVGPVTTQLLLRGVLHGRVPDSAWVRQPGWPAWRAVDKIREVSALRRLLERKIEEPVSEVATFGDSAAALSAATDPGEALLIALHAAAHATSATVGLAHRVRAPLLLPTTSCLFEAAHERLGEVMPWFDPSFALARNGRVRLSSASGATGGLEAVVGARLGPDALIGLAIVPILIHTELHAVIELGRSDHPFRASDARELAALAEQVGRAFQRLGPERGLPIPLASDPK